MPELPEVEIIRRDLEDAVTGKTIAAVKIIDPRVLRQPAKDFTGRLEGRRLQSVSRRGKALVLGLSSGEFLIVQVMMTGQMLFNGASDKFTRVKFEFKDGGHLLYNDQRVFGQLRVVADPAEVKYFRILGPEPFSKDFSDRYVSAYLKRSRRPIKTALMDHTFVAGIGNIYACEILARCGISPKRSADRIKSSEVPCLLDQTRRVLKEAIGLRGSTIRNYRDGAGNKGGFHQRFQVYRREGEPCAACREPVKRIVQAGRSTFYCSRCQR